MQPHMIDIPEGELTMGSPAMPAGCKLTHRWHTGKRVRVAPFKLGRTPVTNAEYRVFLEETGGEANPWMTTPGFDRDDQPVVNTSWHDAQAYCDWLSRKTGRGFRLPTDAEWEYAARGGGAAASPFPWGDTLSEANAWYGGKESSRPVASYPANGFGLHDMIGNVWQWCADRYEDVSAGDPATNKVNAAQDTRDNRVLRGGSFLTTDPHSLYIAYRHEDPPDLRHQCIGFRVAL